MSSVKILDESSVNNTDTSEDNISCDGYKSDSFIVKLYEILRLFYSDMFQLEHRPVEKSTSTVGPEGLDVHISSTI